MIEPPYLHALLVRVLGLIVFLVAVTANPRIERLSVRPDNTVSSFHSAPTTLFFSPTRRDSNDTLSQSIWEAMVGRVDLMRVLL